ncbi:hypothetical protein D3C81_1734670 [compost metagenome]
MPATRFTIAEHATQFVAIAHARSEQAFERVFRRGAQPAQRRAGIGMAGEMGLETFDVGLGVAGRRHDRRLHLQHLSLREEIADQRIQASALAQCFDHECSPPAWPFNDSVRMSRASSR